ncbi:hypothetical protein JR334_03730 [Clostridia bacterium]|nr:hypothetical protein JR334_03730 [Clostridia bacterium]
MHYTGRKLEIVTLDAARYLVTVTTSSIGTGINHDDETIVFPYLLGRMKARSLVGELMSVNAELSVLSATIFLEMIPQGEEIVRGIHDELSTAYDTEIPLQVHFHPHADNGKTIMALMATGAVYKDRVKIDSTKSKDYVYALGNPKHAEEINNLDSKELAKLYCVKELAESPSIHEIIILNGQSIIETIEYIERNEDLVMQLETADEELINKKGYGASCLLFTSTNKVRNENYDGIALHYLGRMV